MRQKEEAVFIGELGKIPGLCSAKELQSLVLRICSVFLFCIFFICSSSFLFTLGKILLLKQIN